MKSIDIKNQLHAISLKNTPKKALILKELAESEVPISANELHQRCVSQIKMDVVTVYRTLGQFKEKGIVRDFLGTGGTVYYEYAGLNAHTHPHFQCEKCNELYCLSPFDFDDAIYFSNMAPQHKIKTVNITFSGLCKACQ